ncbi:hypothetical protein OsI_04364 [Oryza sativa Indica Group]|uniref:Coatomer subunit zeta n=1 Tax=Oryza sativa subsp. indica TaxID=39946 RepID=B8AC44_ORYSI|nr:hypothetical protein OsI_04364 [Oryza sativa Indica Group]
MCPGQEKKLNYPAVAVSATLNAIKTSRSEDTVLLWKLSDLYPKRKNPLHSPPFSSSVLVLVSRTRSLLPSAIASLAQQSATNPPANRGIAPIPSPILQIRFPEMESCPSVKNILVLDSEGKRVAVKYYSDDWPSLSSKQAFEKSVFAKTQKTSARTEAEIVMFDSYFVVYKFIQDLHFFVTGGDEENELILASVLQGFSEAIDYLLRNKVHRRAALENLDLIFLCLDEVVDGGIVLETDAKAILEKVSGHGLEGSGSLTEQVDDEQASDSVSVSRSVLPVCNVL